MIDRIDEVWRWQRITAVKCISLSDDVFNEHFPGYPIFPGSLILEGLAQLSGSFFEMALRERGTTEKRAVLSIVRELKIRRPAGPGDQLHYEAKILSFQEGYGVTSVAATREGELCAQGELMFTFVTLEDERASERVLRSRQELYDIVTRNTLFHDEVIQ
jgi:3-hydroxymyristoyl/3-hydroxydecanoyl-(acyl carrier protein) dehydratase